MNPYYQLFDKYPYKDFQLNYLGLPISEMIGYYTSSLNHDNLLVHYGTLTNSMGLGSLVKLNDFSNKMGFSVFYLKNYLVWDNNNEKHYLKLESRFLELIRSKCENSCIVAKIPIDNAEGIKSLNRLGFYHVCGETIFSLNLDKLDKKKSPNFKELNRVRVGRKEDLNKLKELSKGSHTDIRYLYDSRFNSDLVKSYFCQIVNDSFFKENHLVFVYEEAGEIKGFITAILNKKLSKSVGRELASLDYIAVDGKHQQKSIGFCLNTYALNYLKENGVNAVSVKTMASNYRAIRLLQKNNFVLTSQNVVLHNFTF